MVVGELLRDGRQALLEQVDQVGLDVVAQHVEAVGDGVALDADDLDRDAVEEPGVAGLVTGLGGEAGGHRVVDSGRGLERAELDRDR